jgi:hypothetical protein
VKQNSDLELCIEQIKTDIDKYYFSVIVTIGIRDFVNKNKSLDLKFVSSERKMKEIQNNLRCFPVNIISFQGFIF